MENNNNGGIVLKSNDPSNKGFDFPSAKKCMDFDLNIPFEETSPVDEPSQVFSNNVPIEATLMGGFVNSQPHHVQLQAPTMALGGLYAPTSHHQVHAYNNINGIVQLASSGAGSRVGGIMMPRNGMNISTKRKFDWNSIREEMNNASSENNVIDFTSPLTNEKLANALLKIQVVVPALSSAVATGGHSAGTTSRIIFSPQGNAVESAPTRRRVNGGMTEYGNNKRYNKQRYVFKFLSDVDVVDDGFNWRKYGQKHIKTLGSPRCYYKCTAPECTVKKLVERHAEDTRYVITTYEGKHNHPVPLYRKKYGKHNDNTNNNNGPDSTNNNNNNVVDNNNIVVAATAPPPAAVTTNNNTYGIPAGQINFVGGIFNNNNTNNMNMNDMMMMTNLASSFNAVAPNMNGYYYHYPSLNIGSYDMAKVGFDLNLLPPPPPQDESGSEEEENSKDNGKSPQN